MKMMGFTSMLMTVMAVIEFTLHILALYQGGQALYLVNEYASDLPLYSSLTVKQNAVDDLYLSQIFTVVSLISLIATLLYYGIARRLLKQQDQFKSLNSNNAESKPSYTYLLLQFIVIALGALGIVAITIVATSNGSLIRMAEFMNWSAMKNDMIAHVTNTTIYTSTALALKLLEALLGHWWALLKQRE